MKSFIKSSFLLILLVAVFNVGLSNAYADEVKASEPNTIENVNAVPLQCSMQSIVILATTLDSSSQINSGLIKTLLYRECEPRTIERSDGSIAVISSDCKIAIIPAPSSS